MTSAPPTRALDSQTANYTGADLVISRTAPFDAL
jgi:hypothetical protein